VTAASVLLYVTAGLFVVYGFVSVANQNNAVSGSDKPTNDTANVIGAVIGLGMPVVLAAGLAILAYFVGRGRNGARITTWVAAGIFTLCCGCGSVFSLIGRTSMFDGIYASQPGGNPLDQVSSSELVTTAVLEGLSALALLVAIILLAVPDSNDYFRKPAAAAGWPGGPQWPGYPAPQQPWSAEAPGAATWPPAPGTPPVPGTPSAPGTPGAWGTPGTPETPSPWGTPAPPYGNPDPDPAAWQRPPTEPPTPPQPPVDPTSPPK
jgi:hypothetical protein